MDLGGARLVDLEVTQSVPPDFLSFALSMTDCIGMLDLRVFLLGA